MPGKIGVVVSTVWQTRIVGSGTCHMCRDADGHSVQCRHTDLVKCVPIALVVRAMVVRVHQGPRTCSRNSRSLS